MDTIIENIKTSLIWDKLHESESMDNIVEYLKTKNVDYTTISTLIDNITTNHKIAHGILRPSFIVSILMIGKFPDEMIGTKLGDTEQNIVDKAHDIYIKFETNAMENIHKKLITFKIIFDEWKRLDKENQIGLLCEMYYKYTESIDECVKKEPVTDEFILLTNPDLTNTMDTVAQLNFIEQVRNTHQHDTDVFLKEVNGMRNKILHSMKKLTPSYMTHLNNYSYKNVKYDQSVYKAIYANIKSVYWDNIKTEIFVNKNCDIYKHVIADYTGLLDELNVSGLDISELLSIKDYDIDGENLGYAFSVLCKTIVDINLQVDSENYDEVYKMVLDKLEISDKYSTDVLKLCFNRLETIKTIKKVYLKKCIDE